MLKVLLLVMTVIIGVLGYKVYSDSQNAKQNVATQPKQQVETIKESTTSVEKKVLDSEVKIVEDSVLPELHEVTQKGEEKRHIKNKKEIGEDLQHRSYEEIENDTSLSEEEKEMMIIDKVVYEEESNPSPLSESLSEEEIKKMMLEDFAIMQELE